MNHGDSSTAIGATRCRYCDGYHAAICPRVESIEYYATGAVKKVTLRPVGPPEDLPLTDEEYDRIDGHA